MPPSSSGASSTSYRSGCWRPTAGRPAASGYRCATGWPGRRAEQACFLQHLFTMRPGRLPVYLQYGHPAGQMHLPPVPGGIQPTMNVIKTTVMLATLTGILVAVGGLIGG